MENNTLEIITDKLLEAFNKKDIDLTMEYMRAIDNLLGEEESEKYLNDLMNRF
jgi:hypothetical protein